MAPSNLPAIFNPTQQDIEMLLAAQCHLGAKNLQVHMEPYLWKTRADGVNVLNVGKTWEKIVLAARIIAAIDNPADSKIRPSERLYKKSCDSEYFDAADTRMPWNTSS